MLGKVHLHSAKFQILSPPSQPQLNLHPSPSLHQGFLALKLSLLPCTMSSFSHYHPLEGVLKEFSFPNHTPIKF